MAHRREHGEKSARATELGQAISYRFKRDAQGWRVLVSTEMMEVPAGADVAVNLCHAGSIRLWNSPRKGKVFLK